MTWAEVLAVFNFIVWLLPIILRSWIAWRFKDVGRDSGNDQELRELSESIKSAYSRSKGFKVGNGDEESGSTKE